MPLIVAPVPGGAAAVWARAICERHSKPVATIMIRRAGAANAVFLGVGSSFFGRITIRLFPCPCYNKKTPGKSRGFSEESCYLFAVLSRIGRLADAPVDGRVASPLAPIV